MHSMPFAVSETIQSRLSPYFGRSRSTYPSSSSDRTIRLTVGALTPSACCSSRCDGAYGEPSFRCTCNIAYIMSNRAAVNPHNCSGRRVTRNTP
jgi:hypothetical protein